MFISTCFPSPAAWAAEKPIRIKLSVAGGFDDNRDLDSYRKGDFFTQETASVLYQRLLSRKSQLRLSYNALNLNYFEATDLNVLMNEAGAGVSLLLTPTTIWENDYTFQYLDFLRDESVTSFKHEARTGIRQRLGERWMLRGGFSASYREYTDRMLQQPEGVPSNDEERADQRYAIDAQVTYKARPDLSLNAGTVLTRSDSNDQFHDYYDYDAYKFYVGASWQMDPRWLSSARLSYERRHYDARPLVDADELAQSDHLYTGNLGVYYKMNTNLSLGSIYTYREKISNEPSQEYSGSLGTLGLYGSF